MKIALLGYGKMGRLIEAEVLKDGHTIVAKKGKDSLEGALHDADICIDFSHPDAVEAHVTAACKAGKNIVIGTTGWDKRLSAVQQMVKKCNIGAIYSPNFSLGVYLFRKIVEETARIMRPFNSYDVAAHEMHHRHKVDTPSGTALMLVHALETALDKKEVVPIASTRCGEIPGTHSIIFDSAADGITLTHQARGREGFAQGAVSAALWVAGRKGFFGLDDMWGGK